MAVCGRSEQCSQYQTPLKMKAAIATRPRNHHAQAKFNPAEVMHGLSLMCSHANTLPMGSNRNTSIHNCTNVAARSKVASLDETSGAQSRSTSFQESVG